METLPLSHTLRCQKNFVHLKEVRSTNDYLKQGDFPDGTAVIADRQTAGKGRQGKNWSGAPAGQALYLSVLLHSMKVEDMGFLPLLCGLAVCRTLGRDAFIKWPNDVLLDKKKICGILCESKIQGQNVSAVCGMGLNLAQPAQFFAENNLPHATSLFASTGEIRDPVQAAAMILEQLDPILWVYQEKGFAPFLAEYESRCLTLGQQVRVLYDGETVVAQAVRIDRDGALLCRRDGVAFTVRAGEASVRGLYGYAE